MCEHKGLGKQAYMCMGYVHVWSLQWYNYFLQGLLTPTSLPCMHRHGEAPAVADLMIAVVSSGHLADARDLVAVLIARK